jgi:hypothetical protein
MKKTLLLICIVLFAAARLSAQVIKGNYAIKNTETGLLLRIKDANSKNGTPLVSYYPQNWKCMTWAFKHQEGNTYQLQNLFTNKTFQPQAAPSANVSLEEQPLVVDAKNQQYEFVAAGKDAYLIKLKNSDLYLTPGDKEGESDVPVILAKKDGGKHQLWTIYEQSPTM